MVYSSKRCAMMLALVLGSSGCDGSEEDPIVGDSEVAGSVRYDGDPVEGARVTLVGDDFFAEARTNAAGSFSFSDVPDGEFELGASKRDLSYEEMSVTVGGTDLSEQELQLEDESHVGSWGTIGEHLETFGGTNSGVMLPTQEAMFCHDTIDPYRFNPETGDGFLVEQPPEILGTEDSEQGCHNLTYLDDGRILYVGGGTIDDSGNFSGGESALDTVKAFDPTSGVWSVMPDLNEPRWYPGLVRLADGDLLAFGGGQQNTAFNMVRTATSEVFDHTTNEWTMVGDLVKAGGFGPSVLLFTGEVLMTHDPVQLFNPENGQWRAVQNFQQENRSEPRAGEHEGEGTGGMIPGIGDHPDHSIVMLSDGRVVAIGIYGSAIEHDGSMVEIYDPDEDEWTYGENSDVVRSQAEVLQLPDGRILVAGGKFEDGRTVDTNDFDFTNLAQLYDPEADSWRDVSSLEVAREYHAITLLLPDARVLVQAGTDAPGFNPSETASRAIEAFSPPYLFRGPRPVIEALSGDDTCSDNEPCDVAPGDMLEIEFSNTSAPTGVIMIGMNAVTHFLDAGPSRRLELEFDVDGDQVVASVPDDPNMAIAGYYYLFLLVDDIPSEGWMLHVPDR